MAVPSHSLDFWICWGSGILYIFNIIIYIHTTTRTKTLRLCSIIVDYVPLLLIMFRIEMYSNYNLVLDTPKWCVYIIT